MEKECCMGLDKLKEDYESLKEKHGLPDFEKLAQDFDVEKVAERESSFLLREIRRIMNEKISAYLHLFETFANPSASPVFVFSLLKNASEEDRGKIKEVYKKLSKIEIGVLKLDTIYDEKGEAEFIISVGKEWDEMKVDIHDLLGKLEKDLEIENNGSRKGYFG